MLHNVGAFVIGRHDGYFQNCIHPVKNVSQPQITAGEVTVPSLHHYNHNA